MTSPAEMTGLDYMRAICDGSHPPAPIQTTLGFDLVEIEDGRAVFSAAPGDELLNSIGVVHGGFAGLLLDSCMGAAVHTTCARGEGYSIAPGSGEILASGKVVHRGSRTATAEGAIRRADDGKLLAHGTSTCIIL